MDAQLGPRPRVRRRHQLLMALGAGNDDYDRSYLRVWDLKTLSAAGAARAAEMPFLQPEVQRGVPGLLEDLRGASGERRPSTSEVPLVFEQAVVRPPGSVASVRDVFEDCLERFRGDGPLAPLLELPSIGLQHLRSSLLRQSTETLAENPQQHRRFALD